LWFYGKDAKCPGSLLHESVRDPGNLQVVPRHRLARLASDRRTASVASFGNPPTTSNQETVNAIPRAAPPYFCTMTDPDDELLPQLLAGEESAYRSLVTANHRTMLRLARAVVGPEAAEEVVQEAWIKAMAALPAFERRSPLRIWLLRIVRNAAIGRLRREARAPETESLDNDARADRYSEDGSWRVPPSAWSLDTPEALLAAGELESVIESTLAAMPEVQRAAITLRDIEGLSFDEICNVLDVSASNARVLLHRARRRLWHAIDTYQGRR
jgi:RNA polymerase sigma-70 factor (ECF subfamily)